MALVAEALTRATEVYARGPKMKTLEQAIDQIEAQLVETKNEYEEQIENSPLKGNPYILGLSGKISGLKIALEILSTLPRARPR